MSNGSKFRAVGSKQREGCLRGLVSRLCSAELKLVG